MVGGSIRGRMFERLRSMRQDTLSAVIVVIALVASVTVAALRSDGFERSRFSLNDAGIWVTRTDDGGRVGRVNTEIEMIDAAFPMRSASDDVVQAGASVLTVNRETGQIGRVDVAAAESPTVVTFEGVSALHLQRPARVSGPARDIQSPDPVAAVVQTVDEGVAIWTSPAPQVTSIDPEKGEPALEAGPGSVAAVDETGRTHVFDTASSSIVALDGTGRSVGSEKVDDIEDATITTVGEQTVLLDSKEGELRLPGGKKVSLTDHGAEWVLQQPGPAADHVLVATDVDLLGVDLKSGSIDVLLKDQRGTPSEPVRLGSCDHGAWGSARPSSVRVCDGSAPEVTDAKHMEALANATDLVFRVNRDRILLNATNSGASLLFTPDEPQTVLNWDDVVEPPDNSTPNNQTKNEELDCDAPLRPPKFEPQKIELGARPNRPLYVPVMDLITLDAHPCDVLNLTLPDELPGSRGSAVVIDNGASLQITPAAGTGGSSIEVPFELTGRTATPATGRVQVSVYAEDAPNQPPVAEEDQTVLVLGSKRTEARINVLSNDTDPEGDPLTLVTAVPGAETSDITVRYQADGMIMVSAGSGSPGTKIINYQIVDDHSSDPVEGSLRVDVVAGGTNNQPKARPDRVNAVVGRPVTVDVLANDTDVDGDELSVSGIDEQLPVGLRVDRPDSDTGLLRIEADSSAGSPYFFKYEITDGSGDPPVTSAVRVDVVDQSANTTPVAVRDDVVARVGRPSYVDLVANDYDADGDVLAVTSLRPDDSTKNVTTELFDMATVRVTPLVGFSGSATFSYTVSDGRNETDGKLVVRALVQDDNNLPPIVNDDSVTVRAGESTSVPVLANDVDPEGEQLVLAPVEPEVTGSDRQVITDGTVRAFVIHDEIHVVTAADVEPGEYRVRYTAMDPVPYQEDGFIDVNVVDRDEHSNRAPDDPALKGRIRSGRTLRLRVPLIGLDPDGDVVAMTGVGKVPPKWGDVEVGDGVLIYRAAEGAPGGTDRFTIALDDGRDGGQTEGNVEIVVVPRGGDNQVPVAVNDEVDVARGGTQTIDVLANDTDSDGDELSLMTEGIDAPSGANLGSVSVDGDKIVYHQDGPITGSIPAEGLVDTIGYSITDGRGGTSYGMVTVTILSEVANEAPVARDDLTTPQAPGAPVTVEPLANDYDPDGTREELSVRIDDEDRVRIEAETGAKISQQGATLTVTVAAGEPRSVTIPYTLVDAAGDTSDALIVIPVVTNLPPVTTPDEVTVKAGESVKIDVLANDWDPEQGGKKKVGLSLVEANEVEGGEHISGDVRIEGDQIVFTAGPDASGRGSFAYHVKDKDDRRSWGRVTVEIEGQNFPPTLDDGTVTVSAGGETPVLLDAMADDENPSDVPQLSYRILGGATKTIKADLTGSRGATLVVSADKTARDQTADLRIEVSDGTDRSEATFQVTVTPFEGARPQANPDESKGHQAKKVEWNVLANDRIGDAGPLEMIDATVTDPSAGTVSDQGGGVLVFQPSPDFYGWVTVEYTIGDDTGDVDRYSSNIWRINIVGRPDPPASPTGVVGDGRVDLRWVAPNPNGSQITEYIIEAQSGIGEPIRQRSSGVGYSFMGLQNDVGYRFRVLAVNEAVESESDWSNWSGFSDTYTPDVRPEKPQVPKLVFGDGQITVSWTAPLSKGSAITTFRLQIDGSGTGPGNNTKELPASQTSYVWPDLTNGNSYSFRVAAMNDAGRNTSGAADAGWSEPSNWSDPSDENAVPAGKPLPPDTLALSRIGDDAAAGGTAMVSWRWSRSSHGNGAEVKAFKIVATGSTGHLVTVDGGDRGDVTSPYRITGLHNGEAYSFVVSARTKAGDSDNSASASYTPAKRPEEIPTSPLSGTDGDASTVLSFSDPPNRRVDATYTIPGDGGDPGGFYYRVTETGGKRPTQQLTRTQRTVTGLANGETYAFRIEACNSVGCAPNPVTISNIRPYTNPGRVGTLSTSRNGGTATWSWSAPGTGGRPIKHYQLSGASNATTTSTSTSLSIAEGATLTLCVRAVNTGEDPNRTTSKEERCASINRPKPPATIKLSRGVQIPANPDKMTCTVCYSLKVSISNNAPTGDYSVHMDNAPADVTITNPKIYAIDGSRSKDLTTTGFVHGGGTVDYTITTPNGKSVKITGPYTTWYNSGLSAEFSMD